MAGLRGKSFTGVGLQAAGVRRISMASSLYRAAMSGLIAAAREVRQAGTFEYRDRSVTAAEMIDYLRLS